MSWFKNLNLPTKLTLSRILVLPLLVLLMSTDNAWFNLIAAGLFIAASVTDFVDGYLARKYNSISQMGKLLDPLADKLLVLTALIMLLYLGRVHFIFVVILLGREFAVNSLRGIATEEGVVIASSQLAKVKTIALSVALAGLIMGKANNILDVNWYGISAFFLPIAVILSLTSAYHYFDSYRVGSLSHDEPSAEPRDE